MVETCHLKNIVTFPNCYKFCAVQKNYYCSYIDFSQLAPVYVPEDIENAYGPGFEPVTPLASNRMYE